MLFIPSICLPSIDFPTDALQNTTHVRHITNFQYIFTTYERDIVNTIV